VALHKRLTGGKETCIGIGDWSRQDGGFIKCHPTFPVKKIQKELRRHATVVSTSIALLRDFLLAARGVSMSSFAKRQRTVDIYLVAIRLSVVVPKYYTVTLSIIMASGVNPNYFR